MGRGIELDHGTLIPAADIEPGSSADIQRAVRGLLAERGCGWMTGLRVLMGAMMEIAAGNAPSAQEAQETILDASRDLARVAPTAAQMHFEVHEGGAMSPASGPAPVRNGDGAPLRRPDRSLRVAQDDAKPLFLLVCAEVERMERLVRKYPESTVCALLLIETRARLERLRAAWACLLDDV